MISTEDILMQQALEDQQFRDGVGQFATAGGSILGALAGAGAIAPAPTPKKKKKKVNLNKSKQIIGGKSRLGSRMAGGLIGLISGGLLGKAAQESFVQGSDSAALLAKMQLGIPLTAGESYQLEQKVTEAYNSQIG